MRYILAIVCFVAFTAKAQDLSYYLPNNVSYNSAIPEPKSIIHHNVGEYHITHDRLVNYMQAIAKAAPERVKMEMMGYTIEMRPQVLLIFSSKSNLARLDEIRQEHLKLTNPDQSKALDVKKMPIVFYIGHSIHGNEPSSSNAALLSAYYLAAAQGKHVDELLENAVILFDPSFNPDGLQRFSTWANQHKGFTEVSDPNSREFNEVWPGGRFNHYWFDLNRDWLPAVHPESKNRLKLYHSWKPNILTDHHEQGSNASFFFQPGVPSRVNPLTPAGNQLLTGKLGNYHARVLDSIGSMYFTKENYDDFYYGKGSTFPDIQGAIGILFEQGSSRGHAQQTANGILRFPFTIKNQFNTALSTLFGGLALKNDFLDYQRGFFAMPTTSNGYIFGDKHDQHKTTQFVQMLQMHGIEVQALPSNLVSEEFPQQGSYAVSLQQTQQTLIKAIFNKQFKFTDSIFYDITSWTMPLAFNLPYKEVSVLPANSKPLPPLQFAEGSIAGGKSNYAYVFEWKEFLAPKTLYELQQAGILCKVATNTSTVNSVRGVLPISLGSILIPVAMQTKSSDEVFTILERIAKKNGIKVHSIFSGEASAGVDLGSSSFVTVDKPKVALMVGNGANALDAGEIWHLLDRKMQIPTSHLEQGAFNRVNIDGYNTLIMVSGTYSELNKEKLKIWVQNGGNLILLEDAIEWASEQGVNKVTIKKPKSAVDSGQVLPYLQRQQITGAQQMSGVILGAQFDNTHPLAYGYTSNIVPTFKANKVFMQPSKDPFATPFYYNNNPLLSGWMSTQNADAAKNTAAIIVNILGRGKIINIAENPNFRGFWLGGTKMMMNSIFFSKLINSGGAGE